MWYEELLYRLAIFNIKDVIEIFCFASIFYFFSIWLKQDRQKPLLFYFYGTCTLLITTHLADLPTISNAIISLCPALIMLFILVHQKSLQKNFVTLKNITPAQNLNLNWLEILLRSCIISANNKKNIYCLIESHDQLNELVHAPFEIKAKLQPELLDVLLSSPSYEQNKMIWLSNTGMLLGINTKWQQVDHTSDHDSDSLDNWEKKCILSTSKTDALAFRLNSLTKNFDIITEGLLIEKVPIDQAIKLMRKHFIKKEFDKNEKSINQSTKINSSKQLFT